MKIIIFKKKSRRLRSTHTYMGCLYHTHSSKAQGPSQKMGWKGCYSQKPGKNETKRAFPDIAVIAPKNSQRL